MLAWLAEAPGWVRWTWMTLALVALALVGWRLLPVLGVVTVALTFSAGLAPLVGWLADRGAPRWLGVAAVMGALLALVGLLAAFVVPVVLAQADQAIASLPAVAERLDALRQTWAGWREASDLLPRFGQVMAWAARHATPYMDRLVAMPARLLVALIGTFAILFLVFFFLKDGAHLQAQVLELFPPATRPRVHHVWTSCTARVGRFVVGQLTVMALVATLTGAGLWLLGIPYPLLLGLLVGALDIVPYAGPILGALPGVVLGFSEGWQLGAMAIGLYWAVQQLEGYVLFPLVAGKAVELHPVWIMLALMVGGQLLGLAGAALAVPVAVALEAAVTAWREDVPPA